MEATEDQSEDPSVPNKRTRKVLKKKERESVAECVNDVDTLVLTTVISSKLREQSYFSENLMKLVHTLLIITNWSKISLQIIEHILVNYTCGVNRE